MAVVEVKCLVGSSIALPDRGVLLGDAMLFAAKTRMLYPDAHRRQPDVWEPIDLPARKIGQGGETFYAVSALLAPQAVHDMDIWRKPAVPFFKKAEGSTGRLKAANITLNLVSVPYVYFLVDIEREHLEEFRTLLQRHFSSLHIGKKGNRGRGAIYDVIATPRPDLKSAIVDENNRPLRPIPLSYAKENGIRGVMTQTSVCPPYFSSPRVEAITRSLEPLWIVKESVNA